MKSGKAATKDSGIARGDIKKHTITRDFTVGLVAIVVLVSCAVMLTGYLLAKRQAEKEFRNISVDYVDSLSEALEMPLWDLDEEDVHKIANAFFNDESIASLRITEPSGHVCFAQSKEHEKPFVEAAKDIVHNGEVIGHIQLALGSRSYEKRLRGQLWASLTVLLVNILVIVLMTGVLLRFYIKRPFAALLDGIERLAEGDYDYQFPESGPAEFEKIISRFNRMAAQIREREQRLRETNECLAMEIEEREEVEQALRESEEKYRLVVENANDAIFITQDGYLKFVNPVTERIIGYSAEELTRTPFVNFIHPDDRDMVLDRHMRRMKGEKQPTTYSFRVITKKGEELTVQINVVAIEWEGRPATLTFLRDITHEKRLEERARQAHKMEAIGTLAGGIAHEFNNILGIILGNAELAMSDTPEWKPSYESLEEIRRACLRAKGVVEQILRFSRKAETEQRPVEMGAITKQAVNFIRSSIPTTIEVRKDIDERAGIVLGDANQIQQVIVNLCTNAVQAMGGEGILDVELHPLRIGPPGEQHEPSERKEDAGIPSAELKPGAYVRLTVKDTGHGIDPQIMDRIFDPFFTTRGMAEGTGMGLAMVQGVVDMHRGKILVESEVGKGTTFHIFFPAVESGAVSKEKKEYALPKGNERILLVDDDESLLQMEKRMLEHLGYQVEAYLDPLEALEFFRSDPDRIDLVLADMRLPHMTGEELAEELMKIRRDVPVMLIAGYEGEIDAQKAAHSHIKAFCSKPLVMRELAATIRKVLDETTDHNNHGGRAQ